MMRNLKLLTGSLPRISLIFSIFLTFLNTVRADEPKPARLVAIPDRFELAGMQEGRQLIVTLEADKRIRDLTREAGFSVEPAGIVEVSPQGYVRPKGKGEATITVAAGGHSTTVHVAVSDFDAARPLHFANDLEPLFTRFG